MAADGSVWYAIPEITVTKSARVAQLLMNSTVWIFIASLAAMIFRPPGVLFYHLDRLALAFLVSVVTLKGLALRQRLIHLDRLTLCLCGLLGMGAWNLLRQPYQSDLWAAFVNTWLVPLVCFQLVPLVFQTRSAAAKLEIFLLVTLGYLSALAILFLAGLHSFIFPRFILNENLGIHAERARGPFLQAVANGVTLNLLGLIAIPAYLCGRLRGIAAFLLFGTLPIAILATQTRAVWLSFALSMLVVPFIIHDRRLRNIWLFVVSASMIVILWAASASGKGQISAERWNDESPVFFRRSLYEAGWEMFLEKPLLGWNGDDIQAEIANRVDYHQESFVFHNSFVEVAVSEGIVGLVLYLWMIVELLRLGVQTNSDSDSCFAGLREPFSALLKPQRTRSARRQILGDLGPGLGFRKMWPVLVGVYVLNACFVLMQYQFINALLFSLAGMLAAQNRRPAEWSGC
jgi:O-antigen ligase